GASMPPSSSLPACVTASPASHLNSPPLTPMRCQRNPPPRFQRPSPSLQIPQIRPPIEIRKSKIEILFQPSTIYEIHRPPFSFRLSRPSTHPMRNLPSPQRGGVYGGAGGSARGQGARLPG